MSIAVIEDRRLQAVQPEPARSAPTIHDVVLGALVNIYLLSMTTLATASTPVASAKRIAARRNDAGPLVVIFVVAIAVLLVLAAALSVAVVILCAQKAMNFEWYVKTSWFEVKVACSK